MVVSHCFRDGVSCRAGHAENSCGAASGTANFRVNGCGRPTGNLSAGTVDRCDGRAVVNNSHGKRSSYQPVQALRIKRDFGSPIHAATNFTIRAKNSA